MATELATAYISVVAEVSGIPASIRSALGQAGADADRQGRQVGQRFSTGFGSTMKGMLAAGGVTTGVAAIAGAMKAAISSGMDFESALNTMKATSGATEQQLAAVSQKARELGTDSQLAATSSVDAAQAMLELSKGGMSVEQSMTAARGTLQLAAAAQISAAEAATIQSSALQTFGKDATYAGTASDILANAANASSAEITDVAYALQAGGTVAHQFGMSMGDSAATISLLANAGIKGSDAGTLMKSALLALTGTTEKQNAAAQQLGLTLGENGVQFNGMQDLFTKLGTASKTLTREQYNNAASTLFGSDAMRLAGVAATQGGEGFKKMADAMGRQGAAADVAAAKMSGLPGAWEKLKNSAQDAGLAFYDVAKGPLASMADWGSTAIGKIVETATAAGPKVKAAWDQVSAAVKESGVLDAWGDRLKDVFASLGDSIVDLLPTLGTVGELLGMASAIVAAVGIETFVTALETMANVLEIGVVPVAQALNGVMSSMQPLVVAALAAWMGFRLVGPAVATLGANVTTLQAKTVALAGSAMSARTALMAIATANGSVIRTSTLGAVQMGRFGSAIGQMGTHVPALARMQQSYMNAATAGGSFARTQGVIRGAMTGVRAGVSSLAGALGGPLSAALIGASIAFMVVSSKNSQSTQAVEAYDAAVKNVTASQNGLYVALMKSRGAMTDDVFAAQQKTVESLQEKLDATSKSTGSFLDMFRGAGSDGSMWDAYSGAVAEAGELASTGWLKLLGVEYDHTSQNDRLNQMGKEAGDLQKKLTDLGYTSETLTKAVYGSDGAFNQLINTLKNKDGTFVSGAAQKQAQEWADARRIFQQQQETAKKVVPGITELGEAFRVMGDKSASSADKLSALKSAMDLLNPERSKAEAVSQYAETIRQATESIQGIDKTAFKGDQLDSFTESGRKLGDMLHSLADKSAQLASTGDLPAIGRMAKENQKIFEQLATQTGKSVGEIKALFDSFGGNVVDMVVKLQGDTEVTQKFGLVQMAIKKAREEGRQPIIAKADVAGAEESLKKIGILVHDMGNGMVRLDVTGDAQKKLDLIVEAMSKLPAGQAVSVSAPGGKEVVSLLETMGVKVNKDNKKNIEVTSPLAPAVYELLKKIGLEVVEGPDGKKIIVTADEADYQRKKADWSNPIYKKLILQSDMPLGPNNLDSPNVGRGGSAHDRADGGIDVYAAGGITALESYANGGARSAVLPNQALIQKADPRGGLVQWAEPSTKGEAFIPLADSKRGRSTSILATVAKMFGYDLLPEGSVPDSLSGLAGGITGGVVSNLIKRTGVDGITKFADGGFTSARTAEEFRQLAEGGFEANGKSLQGAAYDWGGVLWGDCSAAQSAFARFAAGLPAFGGRFTTATMATQLQQMGAIIGRGIAGTMRFGWYNGGPGGGHTAGTLPDGTNVEMGGSNGGGAIGGNAAGADDPQFTDHAYFPVKTSTPTSDDGPGQPDGVSDGKGDGDDETSKTGTGNSISTRLGSAVGSMIEGQLADMFEVIGADDSPGWMKAIAEYENEQRQGKDGDKSGTKLSKEEKQKLRDALDTAKLEHKQTYDTEVQKLEDQYTAKQISKADYEQRKLDAKRKREDADLASQQEYDRKLGKTTKTDGGLKDDYEQRKLDRKQAYDAEVTRIKAEYKGRKLSDAEKATRDRRLGDLKIKHDNDDLKAQQAYERARLSKRGTTLGTAPRAVARKVKDPGTDKPKKGTDLPLPKLFDQGGSFGPGINLVENRLGKTETGLPFSPAELKRALELGASRSRAGDDYSVHIGTMVTADSRDMKASLFRQQRAAVMRGRGQVRA